MKPGTKVTIDGLELELLEIIGYGVDGGHLIENWAAVVLNQNFRQIIYERAYPI